MTVKNSAAQSNVSPPVIIATVVLLLIVVGGLGWHFFGPSATTQPSAVTTTDPDQLRLNKLAMDSKGNPAMLSSVDMAWIQQKYGNQSIYKLQDTYGVLSHQAGK